MPSTAGRSPAAFAILYLVVLGVSAGNTALQAVMPSISRALSLPDPVAVAIFSTSATLWMLSAPIWASASDRWGRKPLILLGMAGFMVSQILFGSVVLAGLSGIVSGLAVAGLLLLSRGLFGATGSAAHPAAQAYVVDMTGREQRTTALATLASAVGLGTVFGPALAPLLVAPFGLAGPFFAFGLLAVLIILAVRAGLPGRPPAIPAGSGEGPPPGTLWLWRDPRSRPFLTYALTLVSVQGMGIQIMGFFIIDLSGLEATKAQPHIAMVLMAGAIVALLAQLILVRWLRLGPGALMRWGAGLGLLGNGLMALSPNLLMAGIAYAVASLGYGFGRPGFSAGASLVMDPREQGAMAGALTAVLGAGSILPPLAGVLLYGWWRPLPFAIGALVLAVLLLTTLRGDRAEDA